MDVFGDAGYEPSAPSWPGTPDTVEAARASADSIAGKGIAEVVDHYTRIIGDLPAKPIVIGHSFGGLVAQLLLSNGSAAAAVAIDPAPIRGVRLFAAVGSQSRLDRPAKPGQPKPGYFADRRTIPVWICQRRERR